MKKQIVIGILAHVDSGKTTLSEAMLYRAGEIRKLGRVDHKNTFLDTNEIERERGITIFSKQAVMNTAKTCFTLLDTPGHVDFSAETERTLQILDYAILVISGTDGVQNHTETLWRLLIRYNVPVFIFINKMDISVSDKKTLMEEMIKRLSDGCVDFTNRSDAHFAENAAMCSEELMEEYLESESVADESLVRAICDRRMFPCFFGSALKTEGTNEFLDALDKYTVQPKYSDEFAAKVFKITEDEQGNRLTHMKILGGSLKAKDSVTQIDRDGKHHTEKADRIRIYSGEKFTAENEVFPGSVCAVTGFSYTYPGEGLGECKDSVTPCLEPVLTYKVEILDDTDTPTALMRFKKLEEEEPQLHVIWNETLKEIHIQLMGEVQLEVLRRMIYTRFDMAVDFGCGGIAYRETISNTVEGVGHFEPLRHYAEVHLIIEPQKRGSGVAITSDCSEDVLDKNWQRLILTHLKEKTHIGVLTGSPITDVKITLAAGRAHKKHTEGGDFRQATYRAVRQGLRSAKSVLLEPWYNFRMEIPSENVGRAMTDVRRMGGTVSQPDIKEGTAVLEGTAPVANMRSYHTEMTGYTGGKGRLLCTPKGYEICHNEREVIEAAAYDCDADIENPSDSVFCAHGAGFSVKWDEVPKYMHLESVLKQKNDIDVMRARASEYVRRAADDEELLRIFEKTYGPVKTKSIKTMRSVRRTATKEPRRKSVNIPSGPIYVLVDGYNIIFAWDDLKNAAQDSLETAREMLINRMCGYARFTGCELILVFDAYKVKGNHGSIEKVNNISVVYTKEAETADSYIEKTTHELAKNHRVRVATSDNLEQMIILGNGAVRISAASFLKEVEAVEKEIADFIREWNRQN